MDDRCHPICLILDPVPLGLPGFIGPVPPPIAMSRVLSCWFAIITYGWRRRKPHPHRSNPCCGAEVLNVVHFGQQRLVLHERHDRVVAQLGPAIQKGEFDHKREADDLTAQPRD